MDGASRRNATCTDPFFLQNTVKTDRISALPLKKLLLVSLGVFGLSAAGCTPPRSLEAQAQETQTPIPAPVQSSRQSGSAIDVAEALVKMGPRVAGTPAAEQASRYLVQEYRKAGYETRIQTFTYSKFVDQGSSLTIGETVLRGNALRETTAAEVKARLVAVPNVGQPDDFARVNVRGAIAVVTRGTIPFSQKVENAVAAGAIGVVIVNNQSGNFLGTLTEPPKVPVLALSGEQGRTLLEQASRQSTATLSVNASRRTVTGRNVIAYQPGVTQPKLVLGGHYDSVQGSPGANDNASGTAVTLAIARELANTPLARQVWFVAFDGEEDGLHGSKAFVQQAEPPFVKALKGMMNFDMVGVNDALQIAGSPELSQFASSASADISTIGSNSRFGSDHAPFAAAGVPILFFNRGLEPNYHKPTDRQVSARLLDETTQTALTIVRKILS